MRSTRLAVVLWYSLVALSSARAELRVASVIGDNMVLQRGQAVPIWGTAAPGERVAVSFGAQEAAATADASGKWKATLKPMEEDAASREMTVSGATITLTFTNVLVGEVWLCSGQSNMDWPVRSSMNAAAETAAATYPAIRAFTARGAPSTDQGYVIDPSVQARRYALTPQEKCLGAWQVCTPAHAGNWSGVGYFFARELHQRLQVPVGIVVAAYGATAIEAWIGLDGLKAVPSYRERAEAFEQVMQVYLKDPEHLDQALDAQKADYLERRQVWFAQLEAEDPGLNETWMDPALDTAQWGHVTLPVSVADNPIGSPVASIWFRKDVIVPPEWVGKELELHLGVVDSVDESYVNGVRVGRTWFDTEKYWSISRVYPVPAAAVTSPQVSVSLRLLKLVYHMALFGPAEEMKLLPKDAAGATPVSLAGAWRMRKAQDLDAGRQPRLAPLLDHPPGHYYGHPGVMYNGLIHPLVPYAIRGAIWYQGEANAPFYIDYRSLLPGLIASWRKQWGQGDFPFGVVQLADYWGQQTKPVERGGYTNLRESQAMAMSEPNTFLATAVGVGEGRNIHPKNKQEVSRRLAYAALGTVYGRTDLLYYGPTYRSMDVEGSAIRLHFDFAKGLHAKGDPLVGFAVAGADRAFYFAKARIDGDTVVVRSDRVPKPVAVRFAWATNPVCNLYNAEDLPAYPFYTDSWDLSQLVIPEDDNIVLPSGWVEK